MKFLRSDPDLIITVLICLLWTILFSTGLYYGSELISILVAIIPVLLILFYFFFRPAYFLYLIVFFVPLSVNTQLPGGFSIALPSEFFAVMMVGYLIMNFGKIKIPDRKIFVHPLFLLLLVYLAWITITSAISEDILVSIKRVTIQIMYFIVFYFLFLLRFNTIKNILKFFLFYSAGLIVPVLNGMIWHAQYNFNPQASYYMPQPFFIEHTVYGAAIAFIIPALICLAFVPNYFNRTRYRKLGLALLVCLLIVAEFLAFSRAAWLSLLLLPLIGIVILFRIRQKVLFAFLITTVIFIYVNPDEILSVIGKTDARSNSGILIEQVASISNIQTDISNLERLNRWKSALRMFRDRPFTGHGPGTYQFVYYRYQLKGEMTRISTYHGEKGNSHSEYLGFLAETGFPGLLIYLSIVFGSISVALRIIYRTSDRELKLVTIAVLFSLLTFYFHTIFNGFLETDKLGSLVFGSLAAITALDVYFYRSNEKRVS